MSKRIKLTQAAVAAALAVLAAAARAQNSEAGGGPFEPGAPATIFLTGPGSTSEASGTSPPRRRDLGAPAIVSIGGSEDSATDDGARDQAWLAQKNNGTKQAGAVGASVGAH